MLGQIILGFLIICLGGATVYFSSQLVNVFGRSSWAERNLGSTRNAIILFGFFSIVVGVLFMFGVFSSTSSPLS